MINLENFIDIHIHTAPDIRYRKLDDIGAAAQAAEEGMRAIVLKSHITCTADRAVTAGKIVKNIKVFGSLTLNDAVGGLNPYAVEAALKLGAKIIWLPTVSAENHKAFHGEEGGIRVTDGGGRVLRELNRIFDLIRESDAVLATGHLSTPEIIALVPKAREMGVKKVLITHPEVPWIDMPLETQQSLLRYGVFFERCYVSTLKAGGGVPFESISRPIKALGAETTVISTDFGSAALDFPVEGFKKYIAELLHAGFSGDDIRLMGSRNPMQLLNMI